MYVRTHIQPRFPRLVRYVHESFPTLVNVPGIAFGLRHFGFMTQAKVKEVLANFSGPFVDVGAGKRSVGGIVGDPAGVSGDSELYLEIDGAAAAEFESGAGVGTTGHGRRIYLVGAHLLGAAVQGYAARHYMKNGYDEKGAIEQGRHNRNGFYTSTYSGLSK